MNQRRAFLGFGMGLALGGLPLAVLAREPLQWRERVLQGFGTTLWLRVAHADAGLAGQALDESVALLRRIEGQMSLFDADSALCRLNRQGRLAAPDPLLADVLQLSRRIAAASGGAFDPTVQPLWDVWQRAAADGRLPSARALASAARHVGWRALDASPGRVLLPPGFALSLNGIAQGYAADAVRARLRALGIRHAMLDTGETAVLGKAPGGIPWRFGVEDAVKGGLAAQPPLSVPDGFAVATSSDAHTTFSADRRHHHILDPGSGYSPVHWSSMTVVARSAALADALTKVFFMLAPENLPVAARRWRVRVRAQDKQGRWLDA